MRLALAVTLAVALLAGLPAALAEDARTPEQRELFDVLDRPTDEERKEGEVTMGTAVTSFDRALGKYRSGETSVVNSNLRYNQQRLNELQREAATQRQYVATFWERVAVHFENLKKQFGGDTTSPAYRKAALALKEEYEQRESEARQKLGQLEADLARVQVRMTHLDTRKRLNQIENDLRKTDLGVKAAGPHFGEVKALPTRADQALVVLNTLSQRKTERRLGLLVGAAGVRSAAGQYFDRQVAAMLAPKKK